MAKKSKAAIWEREVIVQFLKWEFLRRNTDFLRSYKILLDLLPDISFDLNVLFRLLKKHYPNQSAIFSYLKKSFKGSQKLNHFYELFNQHCDNWESSLLLNPKLGLDSFLFSLVNSDSGYIKKRKFHPLIFASFTRCLGEVVQSSSNTTSDHSFPAILKIPHTVSRDSPENYLNLSINLSFPKSTVIAYVESLYDVCHSNRKKDRHDLGKYFEYLQVYDMRKTGMDYMDISLETYPLASQPKGQSMEDNIRRQHNTCLSLINGGYRQIR